MPELASEYSTLDGLAAGAPTFVGRDELLRDLLRRLNGAPQLNSVAVLGPRRSGKTSVLHQLEHGPTRARFAPHSADWCIVYMDVSSRRFTDFTRFRRELSRAVARTSGMRFDGIDDEMCLEDVASTLIAQLGRPLVIVLDEFDAIANELRREEQAELRGAVTNVGQFALVLGVVRELGTSLEDTGEVASQFAAVVHTALPFLGALPEADARGLVGVARRRASLPADPAAEAQLVAWAGRHPLLLHASCYGWYMRAGARRLDELADDELAAAREAAFSEFQAQLPHVARSLTRVARKRLAALGRRFDPTERAGSELARLGLTGEFIDRADLGRFAVGAASEPVEELFEALEQLQERYPELAGLQDAQRILLCRSIRAADEFDRFVRVLLDVLRPRSTRDQPASAAKYYERMTAAPTYADLSLLAEEPAGSESRRAALHTYCGSSQPSLAELERGRHALLHRVANLIIQRLYEADEHGPATRENPTPAPPDVPPLAELAALLVSMFDASELTRFLRMLPDGEALFSALAHSASPVELATSAVDWLRRRGALDDALFAALRRERPRRRIEIDAVARRLAAAVQ